MKKLLLIMVLFVMGCGGNTLTDPTRVKIKEDYVHWRGASGVRVVVVEDTNSGKSYFIWNDKAIIELTDK